MTTLLKGSQQSVVHHERAPSQELESDRYPTVRCTGTGKQSSSVTPKYTFMAAGVLRGVRLRPGFWSSSHDLSLPPLLDCCDTYTSRGMDSGEGLFHSLSQLFEQAFGLLPRLCSLLPGFSPLGVDAHALLSHVVSRPVRST